MPDQSITTTLPRRLTVKAFGVTDKGKVRTTNEDQFLVAELTKAMRVWQTSLPEPKLQVGEERAHLFLVADGMGGHSAGERASAIAVRTAGIVKNSPSAGQTRWQVRWPVATNAALITCLEFPHTVARRPQNESSPQPAV